MLLKVKKRWSLIGLLLIFLSGSQDVLISELDNDVITKEELRFVYSYKQKYQTSCGLASAASLLNYYYKFELCEKDVIKRHLDILGSDESNIYRISLYDINQIFKSYGFKTKPVKIDINKLRKLISYSPIIIHFKKPQIHFTVLIGIYKNYFVLADPSIGLHFVNIKEFENKWTGYCLFAYGQDDKKNIQNIKKAMEQIKYKIQFLVDNSKIY